MIVKVVGIESDLKIVVHDATVNLHGIPGVTSVKQSRASDHIHAAVNQLSRKGQKLLNRVSEIIKIVLKVQEGAAKGIPLKSYTKTHVFGATRFRNVWQRKRQDRGDVAFDLIQRVTYRKVERRERVFPRRTRRRGRSGVRKGKMMKSGSYDAGKIMEQSV